MGWNVNHNSRFKYLFSLLIVLLTGIAAIAGILYPNKIYPTEELRQSFLANDVVTLFIVLPILLISMWLARRGKLIGQLFWPGALFYGLYNYCAYLFAGPFNLLFPLYLLIVTLSIYTTIGLMASIDSEMVKKQLAGHVPEQFGGGVLIVLGSAFMLRALAEMVAALSSQFANCPCGAGFAGD